VITHRTKQDLRAIVRWIAQHDSPDAAEHVLDEVLQTCKKLALQPERGARPAELLALGIRRYRQLFFKPYRVVYRVDGDQMAVLLIADRRRDLKSPVRTPPAEHVGVDAGRASTRLLGAVRTGSRRVADQQQLQPIAAEATTVELRSPLRATCRPSAPRSPSLPATSPPKSRPAALQGPADRKTFRVIGRLPCAPMATFRLP